MSTGHLSNSTNPQPTIVDDGEWISASNSATPISADELTSRQRDPEPDPVEEPLTPAVTDTADPEPPIAAKPGEKLEVKSARAKEIRDEINRLTFERRELERINARLRQGTGPAPAAPAPKPKAPDQPVLSKRPVFADYQGNEKYPDPWKAYEADDAAWLDAREAHITKTVEARAIKTIEQRLAKQNAERAEIERQARYDERLERAKAKHADFDQVIENLSDETKTPITPFLEDLLEQHPDGPELLYHLGSHPEEAATLATLPLTYAMMDALHNTSAPAQLLSYLATHPDEVDRLRRKSGAGQLVALGELTARLAGAPVGSPPVVKPQPKAPQPIQPVGGTRASTPRDDTDPADLDIEDFVRVENKKEFAQYRGVRL